MIFVFGGEVFRGDYESVDALFEGVLTGCQFGRLQAGEFLVFRLVAVKLGRERWLTIWLCSAIDDAAAEAITPTNAESSSLAFRVTSSTDSP